MQFSYCNGDNLPERIRLESARLFLRAALGDLIREGRSRKPIFAVADDFALSAAYLLASAAERVFLTQTAEVGSVGVLALHVDRSTRDAQEGFKYTTVFAGARKNDLNPHYPLSEQARKTLQRQVDDTNRLLTDAVGKNRGRSGESIRRLEAGVFQRQEAIRRGLADEVGNANDALRALGERIRRGVPRSRAAAALPKVEGRKLETVTELYARRRREAAATSD